MRRESSAVAARDTDRHADDIALHRKFFEFGCNPHVRHPCFCKVELPSSVGAGNSTVKICQRIRTGDLTQYYSLAIACR
jgi:hypothetical protein